MTTANPSHARPGRPAQAWRLFRRWQRSRPFWGGLLVALAGFEMFGSTRMTVNGLSFHSGATGLLSLLIPAILVTCGLLLWFTPAQRLFYSVVAAITAVYSLIGLNLGGFFVGLLLGIVGSALAFAWTPTAPAEPSVDPATASTDPADDDTVPAPAESGSADVTPAPATPESGSTDVTPVPAAPESGSTDASPPPEWPGRSVDPRTFGVAVVVLGLAATGLAGQPRAVQAAPPTTVCPSPSRAATPSPGRGTPTPTPTPSPSRGGNVLTDILDGIGDLLGGGHRGETGTPPANPTATPTARPSGTTTPRPVDCPSVTPGRPTPGRPGATAPAKPGTVQPGKPLPRIAADPTLPTVAQTPSKLTGTSVRMTGLRFDGITDLHTVKGDLKVLKFSMREAVTADFLLRADGPAGRDQRYATDQLTVRGDVAFYATRFVGRLLGIKITLTPDLPLPEGLPVTSPIPITFTDPVIDLAYVTSDTLTARPALALTLG
ncbi:DUF6114 domain-containing protein [Micromonospora tarensis]|uniref:Uncharacterized protein n=1 Tax=Micromonospora tarensis TaxID=2806100 RepID=A0ABS1YI33_9ACTN|nr:DUF6114 domain-containing protein [Micromonospora tarensis]MBM0277043.1 hypothetical protein [Micromonospora tarensis]